MRAENFFDFLNPDYVAIFHARYERLKKLRETPEILPVLRAYYRENPADFINDWGMTFDPRNADVKLPTTIPFLLFLKQREFVEWFLERWRSREDGICEKSRDMGISWLTISTAVTLCLFNNNISAGFGSRDEDSVDLRGNPDCLFWKARFFIENLPVEFRGDWNADKHSAHMRINFPITGSVMTGDAGKNIGRGGRSSFYVVDEAAHLQHPQAVDAALSQTTNCRIDVSSVNGSANPFAIKRFAGKTSVFTFHWRDDPRKDDAWYEKQKDRLDPVVVAQEIDIDYNASAEGIIIPKAWVLAAVDAHKVLGFTLPRKRTGTFDVADEGKDDNAFGVFGGFYVEDVKTWTGKGSDIYASVGRAMTEADDVSVSEVLYDADGMGAAVRGDSRMLNEQRKARKLPHINFAPFRGSGEVYKPDDPIPSLLPRAPRDRKDRKNGDMFQNRKAQGWYALRMLFMRTFKAVEAAKGRGDKLDVMPDDIISLNGQMKNLQALITELSQPTQTTSPQTGKMVVDKKPEGTKSPNLADCVMMHFTPRKSILGSLAYLLATG